MKVIALFLACSVFALQSFATALTINSPGVIGTVNGQSGDTQNGEAALAQYILNLPANTVNHVFNGRTYNTSSTEYSGTLLGLGTEFGGGSLNVPAGWQYAFAKYDGQNAGYVLFSLNGQATTLPAASYSLWGSNENQYALSHFTTFNSASVPDNASTFALLGIGFVALAAFRRKFC